RLTRPRPLSAFRVGPAAASSQLRADYAEAQRRSGIAWQVLAAVNYIESDFGRMREASVAGAQGPMQFLPSTWSAYGRGSIRDPHAAILAAARFLNAAGGRRDERAALYRYNPSAAYVDAVERYAGRIRRDPRTFLVLYARPLVVRTRPGTGGSGRPLCYIIARAGWFPAPTLQRTRTQGEPRTHELVPASRSAVRASLCRGGGRLRPLPHELAARPARGHGAHAGDRPRGPGRRRSLPPPAVHDGGGRRDRAVPHPRLLPPPLLGHGDRLPDRRGVLRRRRLHRDERRRALERPHRGGGAHRSAA